MSRSRNPGRPSQRGSGISWRPRLFRVPTERAGRADAVAVAAVIAAVVLVAALGWFTGSARTAELEGPALGQSQPVYAPAKGAPQALRGLWEEPNDMVGAPLVGSGNVYTTDGHGVTAWQAGDKHEQWSYHRPERMCGAAVFAEEVVTVFQGAAGCSDTTAFSTSTGDYFATRQSAFADEMTLWAGRSHVLAVGPDRLEIWRDDLVRTVEYGHVEAPQESGMQPRSDCTFQSAQFNSQDFVVAEVCPGVDRVRLTVSAMVPEDSRKPEEQSSVVTGFDELHLIGLTESGTAVGVARAGGAWSIQSVSVAGESEEIAALPGEPELLPSPGTVSSDPALIRWFDGATVHAVDARDGRSLRFEMPATGPGHGLGHALGKDSDYAPETVLVPTSEEILLVASRTGEVRQRFQTAVGRAPQGSPVGMSQIGNILYVQNDGMLRALEMQGSK